MGKSGKINRAEPSDSTWVKKLPDCADMFEQAGWLSFFKKIDGFNSKVSCKFAKALKEDMIVMDALKFKLTVELISEATEIKNEGEHWLRSLPLNLILTDIYYLMSFLTGAKGFLFKALERNGLSL